MNESQAKGFWKHNQDIWIKLFKSNNVCLFWFGWCCQMWYSGMNSIFEHDYLWSHPLCLSGLRRTITGLFSFPRWTWNIWFYVKGPFHWSYQIRKWPFSSKSRNVGWNLYLKFVIPGGIFKFIWTTPSWLDLWQPIPPPVFWYFECWSRASHPGELLHSLLLSSIDKASASPADYVSRTERRSVTELSVARSALSAYQSQPTAN